MRLIQADFTSRENRTFMGGEEYLKSRGVEVIVLDNAESYQLMQTFIKENPQQWYVEQERGSLPVQSSG